MNVIPLDWALIEFPGNQFRGEIVPAMYDLVQKGVIQVVDAVFVSKDWDGQFTSFELNELPDDQYQQFLPLTEHLAPMLTADDVAILAASVPSNSSALIIMWQNLWAGNMLRAIENANARLLAHERVPADVLNEVLAEMQGASN